MSTRTNNYNLVKPSYGDSADIMDINGNMDIIDNNMKSISDDVALKQNSQDNTLATTNKTVVGAINEVKSATDGKQDSSDNNLVTTDKTIVGAINELSERIPVSIMMASVAITTTSGVGQVTFAQMGIEGKTLSRVMASVNYSSAGSNLYAICQISSGYVNVYLRNGITDSVAANGTYSVTLIYMYY